MTIAHRQRIATRRKLRAGRCKKFTSEVALCWRQHSEVSMMMAEVPISRPTASAARRLCRRARFVGPATRLSH